MANAALDRLLQAFFQRWFGVGYSRINRWFEA